MLGTCQALGPKGPANLFLPPILWETLPKGWSSLPVGTGRQRVLHISEPADHHHASGLGGLAQLQKEGHCSPFAINDL